jgi:predicted secreted protein
MKQGAARAALGRRGAASALLLFIMTTPALAGDRALVDFLGYSEDFRYFAFEEFGIQDGSGFPYSNVYVVDLSSDSWVVGTPIRVQAESESETLAAVRAEAATKASGHVDEFAITVPVELVALIGDGAPDADATTLRFGAPAYNRGEVIGNYRLTLSDFPTTAASSCVDWFGSAPLGYQLTITDTGGERLVHRDEGALPRSRGCPMDYRLYGVVMPFGATTLSNAVAVVSVYPGGFEGPDRRFLAVPLGL